MRLIDADGFRADIMNLWDFNSVDGITATTVLKQVLHDLDNAKTVDVKERCIANIHFDKEQLQEVVDKAIIRCKDCKHQKKYWNEDKRMLEKGYWVYKCDLIDDSFVGTPVWGEDNQFCSSAERKENEKDSV